MCWGLTLAQIWQKLDSIESLAKKKSQQYDSINNKLTVLKKQYVIILTPFKPQTWAAITFNMFGVQSCPPLYNKENKIVLKLSKNAFIEKMRK